MEFKLFVSFVMAVCSTCVYGLHNEHNIGPSVMVRPAVLWDNLNAPDKFNKEQVLLTTDVPASDGELAIKSEPDNPPVSGGENPTTYGENAPAASGGENSPVSRGEHAPTYAGENAPTSVDGNEPASREGYVLASGGINAPVTGTENPLKSVGEKLPPPGEEFAPPSDLEKNTFSQLDTNTEEPRNFQPNIEPFEGPDNVQQGVEAMEVPKIPERSDIRHLQLMPGHNISYPLPPTIFPNHSAPSYGEHHPPGVHEHFDDRSTVARINITPYTNPNAPKEKDIAAVDIDKTEKPKPEWKSESDTPFSKFTGFIKGFFDAWAYKIQSFFKQ